MKARYWMLLGIGAVGYAAYRAMSSRSSTPVTTTTTKTIPGSSLVSQHPGYVPATAIAANNPVSGAVQSTITPLPPPPPPPPRTDFPALPPYETSPSSYYGTTNTGCRGFYSLPDRSRCTKQPKAKKCQRTKIFDFCRAGWKTPVAAERIIAKMISK